MKRTMPFLLAPAAAWAAQDPAGGRELGENFRHMHRAMEGMPPAGVVFVILLSLPLVFWGWKIVRAATALMVGAAVAFGVGTGVLAITTSPAAALLFGAVTGILGAMLGWWARQLFGAIWGGVVLGALFLALGTALGGPALGAGAAMVGAMTGLAVGWIAIFYLDAVTTSVGGGALIGTGAAILLQGMGEGTARLIGLGAAVVLAVVGIVCQSRAIARAGASAAAPGTRS